MSSTRNTRPRSRGIFMLWPILGLSPLAVSCSSGEDVSAGGAGTSGASTSTAGTSTAGTSAVGSGGGGNHSAGESSITGGTLATGGLGSTAGAPMAGSAGNAGAGSSDGGSGGRGSAAGGGGGTSSGASGASSGGSSGTPGNGGSGGLGTGPYVCSQLTGGKLTEEWFIAGFESAVDNSRWQVKWREDAYVEVWADAQSSFWSAQVDSSCAKSSNAPDRLVFGTVSFKYKTQTEWRTGITKAIDNFKAKWPTLRRVDLVTQIRGPKNMACPTAPTPGETIAVPPEQDAAMAEVAATFPGFVFVGPKVEAHSCSEFQGGGPHLTAAGNQANVAGFAEYFVQAQ